jgi:protein phosphatase
MVADGMGAHAAGEYASKLAVDHVPHTYHKEPDDSPGAALRKAIEETNHLIHTRGQANLEFQGMGTTCSALVLVPEGALVAQVGDSRVYRLRGNRLEQLSFDHSLVWELQHSGQLSGDEVPNFIPKNIITRSLGPNPEVKVDLEGPFPIVVGDRFLLCSDGLTGQVKNEELAAIVGALPPREAVRALVDLANLRGGPDNITVLVIQVTGPEIARGGAASDDQTAGKPLANKQSMALWGCVGLLALASLGAFIAGVPLAGLAAALTAVLTATIGSILLGRKSAAAEPRVAGEPHGKAPYATAICAANADFTTELTRVLDQLRDAAQHEDWVLDWSKVNSSTAMAQEAAARHDYVAAVREYCRAISILMAELRNQRK